MSFFLDKQTDPCLSLVYHGQPHKQSKDLKIAYVKIYWSE